MVSCLEHVASVIPKPDALVVVSAHWEERLPTKYFNRKMCKILKL